MIGWIGLGLMGEAMSLNMVRAGNQVIVWNRTREKTRRLENAGALVADSVSEVFASARTVFLMLSDAHAVDSVLGRGTAVFADTVAGHTIVHMGTTEPEFSAGLAEGIHAAGGVYVEAPVSGSRRPAEAGELVVMISGEPAHVARVRPLLVPMCRTRIACGPVPGALLMKLSVNLFLITLVTGLAESFLFAKTKGVDLATFAEVLDAGPMASPVSKGKLARLLRGDFEPEASISNVLYNNRLIAASARAGHVPTPLLDVCHQLFAEADAGGHGKADMAAVVRAVEAHSRHREAGAWPAPGLSRRGCQHPVNG